MNKKLVIIVVAILAVIGSAVAYLLASDDAKLATNNMTSNTQSSQNTPPEKKANESDAQGAYVDYSENVIANTTGTKILFFHAPWCPQCRDIESDIKTKGVPTGVTIIKVDYDSNQALRKKYGVALQTTVVRIDDNGELVKKFVAYDDPSLETIKNNLL